jgi:hypothetical protein
MDFNTSLSTGYLSKVTILIPTFLNIGHDSELDV